MTATYLRLRQICLVARELDPVTDDLCAVFGVKICHRDPEVGQFGLHNALMPFGSSFVEVVAPTREGTTAGRYLERRHGDGGYEQDGHQNTHERSPTGGELTPPSSARSL